ncbi:MAG TPA: thiamine-phosphate kinase [Bacteroidales bacterium]|jgi:thiamine-monophosphate kinase|nr:thiamine-phosphate kinase [Bacteroidales bacterium]HNZ42649.1 thiamine-phosphate kinase [Bacteroidales bacterium]HPB24561.1 thiamine-phosphate kinase [Bacteroidales bacterium]HQP14642.1 thiamine-phosphate kinase [Bacteroidales bacterium]
MSEQKEKRTELTELGEFGLIDRLSAGIKLTNKSSVKGIGDDAAVINNGDFYTLVSTDLLVEGVHFDLVYTPLKHLGYKSAVVNFSDICAMNGIPQQLTVGLAVSSRFSVEAIEELYAGIKLACEKYNVDLVGGDTTSSTSGMFLSLTVIGVVSADKVVYRNTANENDLICVSGDLGSAYAGLLLLEREKAGFLANPGMQPDLEGYDYILERQLKPEARKDIVKLFAENDVMPTSMIDISDGLASDILHICHDSGKGCAIYEERIPVDMSTITMCDSLKIDPTTAALNGGEDYELLFTIAQNDYEKIKTFAEVSIIGHITDSNAGTNLVTRSGQMVPLRAQGWNHYRK